MSINVKCQLRPEGSKPRALRREGLIPAALYGHKGAESVSLIIGAKDVQNLLKKAAVNNTLVDVNVPELPWNGKAIIREVQTHPWRNIIYHLSFFSVAKQESIELVVPLKLVGEAIGIKKGGVVDLMLSELNIKCSPNNIPEAIEINVTNFDVGSNLTVGELVVPEGVEPLEDSDRVIFSVIPPTKGGEQEEASVAAEGLIS